MPSSKRAAGKKTITKRRAANPKAAVKSRKRPAEKKAAPRRKGRGAGLRAIGKGKMV